MKNTPKYYLKSLLILFTFLQVNQIAHSQEEDIVISVEEDSKGFVFNVTNTTNVQHEVTLTLEAKNLRGNRRPIVSLVSSNTSVRVARLDFLPNKIGSYKYEYTFKRVPNSEEKIIYENALLENVLEDMENIDEGIVVFSKDGCPRCHYTTSYLVDNTIDFKLIDLSNGREENQLMWALIKKLKPDAQNVVMPVILVNGKLSYSIEDLKGFVEALD